MGKSCCVGLSCVVHLGTNVIHHMYYYAVLAVLSALHAGFCVPPSYLSSTLDVTGSGYASVSHQWGLTC